ncbi:MAG: hypothetical protein Q8T09_09765 [Candidatus Melainabacteria bacterium]|nr:hypothetical protein [Candidatus Melainabacteria bacterium]
MWPNSKGKGGKGGSSKSNDGDDVKPRTKPRATRTKLKAMTAEAARALQETGDQPTATPKMTPEELLEAEIFRAAEQASAEQVAREEQARASGPEFLKIPEQSASLDDQLSGVWKARLMGGSKPTPQNTAIPSPANRVAMEAAEKARTNAQHDSMIGIVDRMFDQFQNLAYDFNQVASASDLELTWIRPSINRENVGNWHSGAQYISVFSGRISTRYWTLVVRGSFETITAHIIPADKLLTFNSAPANYMPMIEMMPYFDGAMVYWSAGTKQLKSEDIQQAARAVLDSLVQVAQEDVPPSKPIDLFTPAAPPLDTVTPTNSSSEPAVSALGGDIDYSERYRQHFSSDSSANLANNPKGPTGNQGNQYPGGFGNSGATSVNNNSVNGFRQFPPSQPSNMMANQPGSNAQSSSDDWKPVVRSVRGAAGPQPLQHLRQFQNAPVETSTPTPAPTPANSPIPTNSPIPASASTPNFAPVAPNSPPVSSFTSSSFSNPPNSAPPGVAKNASSDDGWRGVDANNPSKPMPSGASSGFKPAFPALPSTPVVSSDSFVGGTSQSLSGPRSAAGNASSAASSDDWNFVPVEKETPKQAQRDSGAHPPVNFPSNLFADMPSNLGFPSSSAPSGGTSERPNLPVTPTQPQSSGQTGSSSNFSSPFARPFSATSAAKPSAGPVSESPSVPPVPSVQGPAGPSAFVPAASPLNAPAPPASDSSSSSSSDSAEVEDSDANPFYTPLVAPVDSTASGASPWSAAPAAAQIGNKADFNPSSSSTHTGMISPPKAPMPIKEAASESTFFETELPAVAEKTEETEETKTVEIATTGQFSVARFAFDIANQAPPTVETESEQHAVEARALAEEDLKIADTAEQAQSELEPEPESEPDFDLESRSEFEPAIADQSAAGADVDEQPHQTEDTGQDSFDDGDEDRQSAPYLEVELPDSGLENPTLVEAEIALDEQEIAPANAADESSSREELESGELANGDTNNLQVVDDSSFDDSAEDEVENFAEGSVFNLDSAQREVELASLAEIEEEAVEAIAELEEELILSGVDLFQEVDQPASPWCGPVEHPIAASDFGHELASSEVVEQPFSVPVSPVPLPTFTPVSASLGSSAPLVVAASEHSLKSEIVRVITAFDKELELISTKGSDAFARRDLKGAEHMIKLAEIISEYKDGLAKLKDEYDKDLT